MADEIQIEEMLEYIWILEENSGKVESTLLDDKFGDDIARTYLAVMVGKQLISLHDSIVKFTKTGKKKS